MNKCRCGKVHTSTAEHILNESGAIEKLPELIKEYGRKKVFLVADTNTYKVAGKTVEELLKKNGIAFSEYVSPNSQLKPNEEAVGALFMHFDNECDTVVGLGSGVINDLCKILSCLTHTLYIIVATAPSMDGYASASSSVDRDGIKVSVSTKSAEIIIGDTDILKDAPEKMLKAGLGDMLAKYISIAEWRISNVINGEYYCREIAQLIRDSVKKCVDSSHLLLKRDEIAVQSIFDGLVNGGIAMSYAGVSRPASGVEHYFSHIWDMRALEFGTHSELHGLQCAVATLEAAKIYDKLRNMIPDRKRAVEYVEEFSYDDWKKVLKGFIGKAADKMAELEIKEQKYSKEKHNKRLERIIQNWGVIVDIINEDIPHSTEIKRILKNTGIPCSASELGFDESILPLTFKATNDIRDKYVASRLCWDMGIIDEIYR